jgi:hypothetical protein
MCVTVAMKLPRDGETGLPTPDAKWRLAKIRDRMYVPEYGVKRYTVKEHGASQLFLVDENTDWTEGVSIHENGSFLGMVNSALNNTSDKKDGKDKSSVKQNETVALNGSVIRRALKTHNIDECVKVLIENKIDGCTLVTDGDRLFVIETTLPADVKEKYRHKKTDDNYFEDFVPLEEYATVKKEIKGKEDYLIVRTNSGVFDKSFGYQKTAGPNYNSSLKRRKHTIDVLKEKAFEPIDLITTMSKLGDESIDKNPYFRPVRRYDLMDEFPSPIFSTAIIQADPSGTMIVKPLECKFNIQNMNNLIDDKYLAHMFILPHRSKMFESFKQFTKIEKLL